MMVGVGAGPVMVAAWMTLLTSIRWRAGTAKVGTNPAVYIGRMNELDKFKEDSAMRLFGRSRVLAIAGKGCVKCGESAVDFRDEISKKEFGISGFCQSCQDDIFGGPDGDDDKDEVLDEVHPIFE